MGDNLVPGEVLPLGKITAGLRECWGGIFFVELETPPNVAGASFQTLGNGGDNLFPVNLFSLEIIVLLSNSLAKEPLAFNVGKVRGGDALYRNGGEVIQESLIPIVAS